MEFRFAADTDSMIILVYLQINTVHNKSYRSGSRDAEAAAWTIRNMIYVKTYWSLQLALQNLILAKWVTKSLELEKHAQM